MELLEAVAEHGSISAAARSMGMAYRHAWVLIDDLNRCFGAPVVATATGGRRGGGARLTPLGAELVRRFRAMERRAGRAVARELRGARGPDERCHLVAALRPARRRARAPVPPACRRRAHRRIQRGTTKDPAMPAALPPARRRRIRARLLAARCRRPDPPAAPVAPPAPEAPRRAPDYDVYVTEDQEVVEQIGPRRVIDEDRIRERSARTLDEVLRLEPGVYVRTGNEGVPRVDMRGLRSRHVLLLLDGIPFNSTEDGQFDPALIPSESMERVKLQFGNASTLYGDGPMAGVVQVETRRPGDGLHGSLGGDFRSEEQLLGRFTLSGQRGDFDGLAAGSGFYRHGFPLADASRPAPARTATAATTRSAIAGTCCSRAAGRPARRCASAPCSTPSTAPISCRPTRSTIRAILFASRVRYERVEDQTGFSGQLSMQWDPEGPLEVRSWLYANAIEEDRRRYDDDGYDSMGDPRTSGTGQADNDSLLSGHALHAGWTLGEYGKLEGVFQSRREDFASNGTIRDVRLGGGRFAVRAFDDHAHQTVYNGGLEYEVEPLRDVGVVLGYTHSFLDKDSGENDDGATLLAGTFWKLRPGTRLRGSVSRKVRFPSLLQLYEPGRGNPDLEAEHSWDYEIGLSQELPGRTLLDVTAFWLDVDDYIEQVEAGGLFANQDRYRFRGVELTLATHPFEALDLLASYTFMDSENRSSGVDQDELQNRPEHRTSFEARYRLPWGFAVRGALYYVAEQSVPRAMRRSGSAAPATTSSPTCGWPGPCWTSASRSTSGSTTSPTRASRTATASLLPDAYSTAASRAASEGTRVDLLVAIDDTDNAEPGCVGTGRLARMLARELVERGLAGSATVTRHQLLVHPDIPYTSHNSAACVAAGEVREGVEVVADAARRFLLDHPNQGANPGLCVLAPGAVPPFLLAFARRAQSEVLALQEADRTAARLDGVVWWHGETGQGRIGALAAAALRHSGEDGRFIGLSGIRALEGVLTVGEIRTRSPVARVETLDGEALADDVPIDTQDWVRPALRGGQPVLRVRRIEDRWVPEEKWRKYR